MEVWKTPKKTLNLNKFSLYFVGPASNIYVIWVNLFQSILFATYSTISILYLLINICTCYPLLSHCISSPLFPKLANFSRSCMRTEPFLDNLSLEGCWPISTEKIDSGTSQRIAQFLFIARHYCLNHAPSICHERRAALSSSIGDFVAERGGLNRTQPQAVILFDYLVFCKASTNVNIAGSRED